MDIHKLKKEININNKDIADFFGLNLQSFQNSSAKKRYENALVKFYLRVKKKGAENSLKNN